MKNQEYLFPGDKCFIFDFLNDCFCASYERVRIPSVGELTKIWKDQKIIGYILFCFNLNIFNIRGVL